MLLARPQLESDRGCPLRRILRLGLEPLGGAESSHGLRELYEANAWIVTESLRALVRFVGEAECNLRDG